MSKGKINVAVENIFPLIKKFLYSDHEVFLRELISNATDATLKLRHLTSIGEAKVEYGSPKIEVKLDKKKKTLSVIDQGIGMTADEVKKYINEVAFSGAEEFLKKYEDATKDTGIIGHFGLGFYSSFMVSKKVEIITKSFRDEPATHWVCDGSPEFELKVGEKADRGTEIVMHIADDSKEFLEEHTIQTLLTKYNRFMPIPIKFGVKKEKVKEGKDNKEIEVDNIINNPDPAWTKQPSELKEEDYKAFYRELYPMQFEEPLFQIHLNVDHPFHLTGVLYFPKITNDINLQKNRIQLYQNQVFVTDNVEGIVPEFLTLLRGVIDSPDIPLNVSRSALQADGNVKKISNYITRKVADKLNSLFKTDRKAFEKKWNDIKIVVEYGMLSDDKFFEKAENFALFPTVGEQFFTLDEFLEKIKNNQVDKDEKTVILYASDKEKQHSFIEDSKEKGYEVLLLDSPIVPHLIQKLETAKEKLSFARVDADDVDNLIKKDKENTSKLSEEESKKLQEILEEYISKERYNIQLEALESSSIPFKITQPEFMRRMKDMQASGGGGMFGMGNMPEIHTLIVNKNSDLVGKILESKTAPKRKKLVTQSLDLARLSQGLLSGEELTEFIKRSYQIIQKG
ncbi:chaperone protein htpG [Elysia marginata]|uniref:Chaperone protein htpG n=1 Tax=Elysia marginata TaxID=1093978 RepID=A0AAV4G891_9GAST|nr:chaperone protein htpG [Elysia marginata]